jgi:hypothetical protein
MTTEMMTREDLTELSDADLDCVAGGQMDPWNIPRNYEWSTVGGYDVCTQVATGQKTYYVHGTSTPLGTAK